MAEDSSTTINILLLGETGVGKSTLINACANYLRYDTFEDALKDPICLIPTKFAFTDQNDENQVLNEFPENYDHENKNENMEFGQSGTLSCMSYVLPLEVGVKVRWIDSSGFGDTQGSGKDRDNLIDILEYVAQFRNIHVIAIVCKADANRVSNQLENDLKEVFKKLGNSAFKNVVMIFSHGHRPQGAASVMKDTFGNIKRFLLLSDEIKFDKKNMFCFENQPFRELLIAKKTAGISKEVKIKNEKDWKESKAELMRLISSGKTYLEKPFDTDHLLNANLKYSFIRNMCVVSGTILLNLRENLQVLEILIIKNQELGNDLIIKKLSVEDSEKAITVCLSEKCHQNLKFWEDKPFDKVVCCPGCDPLFKLCKKLGAVISNCEKCGCSRDHHDFIYYKINFEKGEILQNMDEMKAMLDELRKEEAVLYNAIQSLIKHVEEEQKNKKSIYSATKSMSRILRSAIEHLKNEQDQHAEETRSVSMIKTEVQNLGIYGKLIKDANRATKKMKKEDKIKRDKNIPYLFAYKTPFAYKTNP